MVNEAENDTGNLVQTSFEWKIDKAAFFRYSYSQNRVLGINQCKPKYVG